MQPSTLTQDHNHVQQLQQSQPSALQHRLWSGLPSAQCHLAWFPSAGHAQQLAAVAPGLWRSAPAPAGNFAALAPAPVALAEIQAINETVSARACRTSLYSCSMPDPGWTAVVAELPPFSPPPLCCWLHHLCLRQCCWLHCRWLQPSHCKLHNMQAAQHGTAPAAISQHTTVPVQVTEQSLLTQMGVVLQVAGAQFAADIERAAAVNRCVCLRRQSE